MVGKRIQLTSLVVDPDDDDQSIEYHYDAPGTVPGTLTIPKDAEPPVIDLIDYNEENAVRLPIDQPEKCQPYLDTESVSWVDVRGLGSEDILLRLGRVFSLHPLLLEDVVNVPQRPKMEEYDDQVVIITRMVVLKESGKGFYSEQVSLILGKHYVLSVQEESKHDCFGIVRDRIRSGKGSIRKRNADYLAYALLDAIVDGFFPILEVYGEEIEELEEEVVESPSRQTLEKIHHVKRELLTLRRSIWPLRDAINSLIRDSSNDLVSEEAKIYLRDCYDHTVQVLDMVETYRELAASLMDVYLSSVSNRMNEIMKVLTVISTIFIPLTFVAGVYGMNFNPEKSPFNMPELNWYWGYPVCWAVMLSIAIALVFYFKRKGWFEDFATTVKK